LHPGIWHFRIRDASPLDVKSKRANRAKASGLLIALLPSGIQANVHEEVSGKKASLGSNRKFKECLMSAICPFSL